MAEIINVVEPTLMTEAGHCYSFISAFCGANDESRTIQLWVNRRAELTFAGKNIQIEKYFFRRIRRLQSYFLYKKLLAMPGKLFISTAGRADLLLVDWASKGVVPPGKVYFYFHWFRVNDKKLAGLREIARKQPNLEILGPTPSVIKIFQDAGFNNAHVVPYPISSQSLNRHAEPDKFSHLLYAGAARKDKGFSHVVDLVQYMHERGLQIPIMLQTSPEHFGKYDAATQADIQRLHAIGYPHLRHSPATLSTTEYADLFAGAICLQLYDQADFADRVSGVTLDAFSAGCPIVATAGTWIARMAQRFDAGVAVADMSPPQVLSAVQRVIDDYASYNQHARAAGKTLQEENNAETLFRVLAS
jgi:glycosyltransferase involved in cell wall biosynthesis